MRFAMVVRIAAIHRCTTAPRIADRDARRHGDARHEETFEPSQFRGVLVSMHNDNNNNNNNKM
jgi:hypothetical protein